MAKPLNYILIIFSFSLLTLISSPLLAITSSSSSSLSTASSAKSDYKKAYRYEKGIKVRKSQKNAIKWYKKAANKSHRKAQYRLGILYYKQKNYKKAKYWLEKRAKDGEPDAQYHHANILRFGLGTKQRTSSARKWYLKAAKQGHKHAQYELGLMFKKGIGAKKNLKTAKKWFRKAAKQNHKHAKQALKSLSNSKSRSAKAKIVNNPKKAQKPKKTAQQRFLEKNIKLAKAGDIKAQYNLGKAYKTGKNAPKSAKESLKWLGKAAHANHAEAQYLLASIYFEGSDAATKNLDKAKTWYGKAADNEHKKANKKLDKISSSLSN